MNTKKYFDWIYKYLFVYLNINQFTNWGYILIILFYLGILTKYQYSILLLLIFISIVSIFINYINPGYITFNYKNIRYKINKPLSLYLDLIFHHVPLIIFIIFYNPKIPRDNLVFACIIFIIYLLLFNPFNVYNINISGLPTQQSTEQIINLN